MVVFAKGAWYALDDLCNSGYDVVGLDWTVSLSYARSIAKDRVTLQGNMDPGVLYGGDAAIQRKVKELVESINSRERYIVNLGHGITPGVDPEALRCFLEANHKLTSR